MTKTWYTISKDEKIEQLKEEERREKEQKMISLSRLSPQEIKEKRLEEALKRKQNWKKWREEEELEDEKGEEFQNMEEIELIEEEEVPDLGQEDRKDLCLDCIISPCICDLLRMDLKIKILRRAEIPEKEDDDIKVPLKAPPEDNLVSIANLPCQEHSQEESEEDEKLREDQELPVEQKKA